MFAFATVAGAQGWFRQATPNDTLRSTEGNAYDFAYGLNWSGRINDARVKKYAAK